MNDRDDLLRRPITAYRWTMFSVALALLAIGVLSLVLGGCDSATAPRGSDQAAAPRPRADATSPEPAKPPTDATSLMERASQDKQLSPGRTLYLEHCAACHGDRGDGQGIAARYLFPKPRDFRAGRFRLISTTNSVPSRDDLLAVLMRGMPGSSMPSWAHLTSDERNQLVEEVMRMRREGLHDQIVKQLKDDDDEINEEDIQAQVQTRTTAGSPAEVPSMAAADEQMIARGKQIFLKQGCSSCHGNEGRGDGQQVMVDAEGLPTRPRDFTRGIFKGNDDLASIYRRIALGMPGTPMPASANLKPEQISDLSQFILSLSSKQTRDAAALKRNRIVARFVQQLPAAPEDDAWKAAEETAVRVTPLWWRDDNDCDLRIAAMHDGKTLSVRMRWRDSTPDWNVARAESFKDSAAMELYRGPQEPFIGMGSAKTPIDVWFWDADRQKVKQPPENEYPNTVVDVYPFSEHGPVPSAEYHRPGTAMADQPPVSLPAVAAGNQISVGEKPAASRGGGSSLTAGGPGSATFRPPVSQLVEAIGQWRDGQWSVVFKRPLAVPAGEGVPLAPGDKASAAFAVWDGARGDRNGQKMISIWQDLQLEKGSK
jgi:mono/diheme cytochrome c family protein